MMRLLLMCITVMLVTGPLQLFAAENIEESQRFQAVGTDIVIDTQTGLMWAARDNGKDIDWYDAKAYCKNYAAGRYEDWRLPDMDELATLYTEGQKNKDGFYITEQITITNCCIWSADENMGGSEVFSYKTGRKSAGYLADSYQLRALPVRSVKQEKGKE